VTSLLVIKGNQISGTMERITCLQAIFSRKNKVKVWSGPYWWQLL
jgi:hypothetical protein